ncbi:3-phosphoshikimate 1-carboxyvinyltransferase [Halorussus gelatinilyticus]|uniref:3-phosphoshikimate 1-carboxyvinyltransferase n=1 Tax=Halorussus gelatinilyticus TaxID=2937524 RepID=A0A8U0IHA2_9EURY|nr:3-phosphoshikimate 1-carboxyvinyltransferase [Halorussus gelatinilyticus]UPW00470.1 3-phosphoshikimate 1-carboxyvinyltransferase [Halorussus gelatinilyticus]
MDVGITPSTLSGTARAPSSKSYTHRAILAAGYSGGALVYDPLVSADTKATMRVVDAFGGDVTRESDHLVVDGFDGRPEVPGDVLDCGNSGTTMRLVTGAAALADGGTVLTGDSSLRSRPHGPLLRAIDELGGSARSTRKNGQAPLVVDGPISGGTVSMPGDVSSQFVTALLMAGAVTDEGIEVELETELKSAPYVDITLELLDEFGVEAGKRQEDGGDVYRVEGGQFYEPADGEYHVPGDFSSISYLLAAGAIAADESGEVRVRGAYPSAQGDSKIVGVLERMGADVDWNRDDGVATVERSALSGVEVDVGDTPDLLPTVAVLGAVAEGETRIVNCEHVRYKETDRVSAMAEELEKLGAATEETEETLTIRGGESELTGARLDGRGDHRVVMSLAVAALAADGPTTISGGEHVDVSFPDFFDVLYDLGATVNR